MSSDADSSARRGEWGEGPRSSSRGAVSKPRAWYRRRAALVGVVVAVIVVAAVVSDLPTKSTHAQQVADTAGFVTTVYGDLTTCSEALAESFTILATVEKGNVSPSDRSQALGLLEGDQSNFCSLADDSIFQLATVTVPRFPADSTAFMASLQRWAVPDGYRVIGAIVGVVQHPGDPGAEASLSTWETRMRADLAAAKRALGGMEHQLRGTLPAVTLAEVPAS